jgi:hypothetical protein
LVMAIHMLGSWASAGDGATVTGRAAHVRSCSRLERDA